MMSSLWSPVLAVIGSEVFTYASSFVILWSPRYFKSKHDKNSIQNIVISLGIFGTFLGIFAGLMLFDTNDIGSSIPDLLDGLKTAFLTSIAGSAAALLVKTTNIYQIDESVLTEDKKDESTLMLEELQMIRKGIAGDEDSSMVTQLQKLRTSQADKQDELKKAFDDFATKMAENNVNALIEAVQKVMEDFDAKINSQLGENFKRLSEATENLVTWQDQYREQLATSAKAIVKAAELLEVSSESVTVFAERAKEFEDTANSLKVSLETMGASMTGLKNLADSLDSSGKQIRAEMSELTKDSIRSLGENLKGISEKLVEDYSYLQKMMQTVIDRKID
jgi:archaellum component FlaC